MQLLQARLQRPWSGVAGSYAGAVSAGLLPLLSGFQLLQHRLPLNRLPRHLRHCPLRPPDAASVPARQAARAKTEKRARALAEASREDYRALGDKAQARAIQAWLNKR